MPLRGDEIVSLLVCLSLLAGLVVGLRFNVRMLVWVCLATIVTGALLGSTGTVAGGRSILMTTVAVVALQVGYFVALVIGAMRLTEEPAAAAQEATSREPHPQGSRPSGA